MLVNIADKTFLIAIFLNLPIFRLKWSYLFKEANNLFELSSYSTYPEFDLSGVLFCTQSILKPREMTKLSRSEELDLTGSRLIEVQLYIYYKLLCARTFRVKR